MSSGGCPCWPRGCRCRSAPPTPFRGGPLATRAGLFADNLQIALAAAGAAAGGGEGEDGKDGDLSGHLERDPRASRDVVLRAWADALAAPAYAGPPLWLHG